MKEQKKRHKAIKNFYKTVDEVNESKEAQDARDEAHGAVLINDYLLKQINDDPANYVQDHEVTKMMVGKPKG